MRNRVLGVTALLAGLCAAPDVPAQEPPPAAPQPFEPPPSNPPPPPTGEPPPSSNQPPPYTPPPPGMPPPPPYVYEPIPPPPPPPPPPRGHFQFGAQVGYLFGSSIDTATGNVGVGGAVAFTASAAYVWHFGLAFRFSYTFAPSSLNLDPFLGPSEKLADLGLSFFQLGVDQEFLGGAVRPFVSFSLGMTLFDPDRGLDSETRFSTAFGLGVNFYPTERFGLRAQARFLSTFEDSGSSVFCGFGGCTFGTFGWGITQAELTAGAFVNF